MANKISRKRLDDFKVYLKQEARTHCKYVWSRKNFNTFKNDQKVMIESAENFYSEYVGCEFESELNRPYEILENGIEYSEEFYVDYWDALQEVESLLENPDTYEGLKQEFEQERIEKKF